VGGEGVNEWCGGGVKRSVVVIERVVEGGMFTIGFDNTFHRVPVGNIGEVAWFTYGQRR
jgi:hypothetical protein